MNIRSAQRMRRIRVCAALAALTLVFASFFGIAAPALAEDDGMVRVRLTRLGVPSAVAMVADCDYYLASDPAVRIGAGERMTVSAEGEGLTLAVGRKRIALGERARLMRVSSGNVGVRFVQPELSNRFCGDLGFFASGGVINTILNIYIENYLYGVVGYEMPPSSGIEALKAQAVAARTYALRKKETRADADYDLTDTTADQVFRGYSAAREYANTVRAVDATRGGVGTVLYEIASQSGVGIRLDAASVPVDPAVGGVCRMLGLEPLYLACEGRLVVIAPKEQAPALVEALRSAPHSGGACIIGEVTDERPGWVVMKTEVGAQTLLPQPTGELLPRIC